jgi:hypothetical protein
MLELLECGASECQGMILLGGSVKRMMDTIGRFFHYDLHYCT